ncbi:uncharacterized protein LOC114260478 [Camellia sinensis]|uniref:uncharacterized protein LOC114260478 n=1 Tax=Camellia sinensis TaxID=4442 RepID=UPI001035C4B6|nr:uncharacterized protein LOC114260478 [Camellia sinensis]
MEAGGWRPVVRKHGGIGNKHQRGDSGIHTVFVDNLPESMDPKGLYTLFTHFGVVQDVFIPHKRRKMTHSRFGFVRYYCSITANMAVQKVTGLWCDSRALTMKVAEFVRRVEAHKRPLQSSIQRKEMGGTGTVSWKLKGKESFAQVVSGKGSFTNATLTVKVYEVGNGWLHTSAIVRLKLLYCGADFKTELRSRGMEDIEVREGGSRDIVLSFPSVENMREKLKLMEVWVKDWAESVTEWKQGMSITQERDVCLSCYGMPLNVWNNNTFYSIGRLWGEVTGLADDTSNMENLICGKVRIVTKCMESINKTINLDCKGVLYPIKVCEDQIVTAKVVNKHCICHHQHGVSVNHSSYGDEVTQRVEAESKQENGDDDVEALAGNEVDNDGDVAVTCSDPRNDDCNGREGEASCKSISVVAQTVSGMEKAISGGTCGSREVALVMSSINVQNGVNRPVDGDFSNPGLLKSLSGSDLLRLGLNIEVVLTKAHELNDVETQTHKPPGTKTVEAQTDLEDSIQPCSVEEPIARNERDVRSEILGSSAESIQKRVAI